MADEPLTITEVYRGYRSGNQQQGLLDSGCCWGAVIIIVAMISFSVFGFAVPEPYEHVGLASLSTLVIWATVITNLEHVFLTSLAALLIAFGLSAAWDYLPYLMTGITVAIAIAQWWMERIDTRGE